MAVFKWSEILDDRYFPEVAIKILAGKPIKLGKEGKGKSDKNTPQRGEEWPKEVVFDITAFKALYKITSASARLAAVKSKTKDYFIGTKNHKFEGITYPWVAIFKGDFSTGGSGGGASKTEIVESLQCYYNSLLYNGSLSELKDTNVTSALLKTTEKYCDTKLSLDQLLKAAPKDWRNSFIESANAIYKYTTRSGMNFSKPVYFHRGSKFMDSVYNRKKRCMKHDKALAKERGVSVQAPSSFSDDKWNPGDIWMSTLPKSSLHPFPDVGELWEGKLGVHTCDWYALQSAVYTAAQRGITMGVSLKKIGNNGARVQEYNNKRTSKNNIKYEGFVFGKNGNFFSSTDIYLHFSGGQEMQLRSFNGTTSWQGEIKGGAAAGGKIGGGGINYYTEKHFGRTIGSNTKISKSKGNTHNWAETTSPNMKDMYKLYVRFNERQKGTHTDTIIDNEELFIKTCKQYKHQGKDASKSFIFSKYMGLLCLEAIDNNVSNIGGHFGQDIFRYAASNTEFSSFFVKIS